MARAKKQQKKAQKSATVRKPKPRKELVEESPKPAMREEIHGRAMLVSLRISFWAARRFDKQLTEKVNAEHAASKDAGRYNKHLFGGEGQSHTSAVSAAGSARATHYEQTLPWLDEGWRLLPSSNFESYSAAMREARAKFERLVDAFLDEYEVLKAQARALLNGLYRDEDYPSVDQLRGRFSFAIEYAPLPARGDFRLDLPAEQLREIEGTVENRIRRATDLAMRDAWNRLYEIVAKIHERMSDPENTPKKSLFEIGQATAQVLARLNVTGDASLEAMRERVEKELLALDAKSLRDDEKQKQATAARAAEIMASMQDIYGGGLGEAQ